MSVTIRVAPGAAPRGSRDFTRRHPIRWAVPRSHAETFPGCRLRRDAEALRRRARRPVRRTSSLVARASGDDRPDAVHDDDAAAPSSSSSSSSSALLTAVADAKWFNTYIHGAVFVLILGFIDAGYSRDWTRIGAITPEFEQRLRDWAVILGWVHVAAAAAAAAVANARGLPAAPAAAKTFLVGFLAFLEVCFKTVPEGEGGSESP